MPRDFKQFINENKNKVESNPEKTNEYEKILNKYKDMDQNSLMHNLLSEASKLKKEGKLDHESINSIRSTLSPFLNEEQQKMLNELVNAIDEQK